MSATVRSMTGYGRGEHIAEERKFTVEMKSVNHRYNDMTIKLPRSLASLEDKIKKRIMRDVFRGKTDVYISFETFSAADVEVKLNETLAAAYIEKLNLLEEKFGLTGSESKLELVAKFPDVVTVEKTDSKAITITCDVPSIPTDEKNIAYKAAKLFFEKSGIIKYNQYTPKKENGKGIYRRFGGGALQLLRWSRRSALSY